MAATRKRKIAAVIEENTKDLIQKYLNNKKAYEDVCAECNGAALKNEYEYCPRCVGTGVEPK